MLWSLAISFFFGALSSIDGQAFTLYVVVGFLVFSYITSTVNEGCNVFLSARRWLQSANLPVSIFVFKDVARGLINFAFSLIAAIILLFIFGYRPELDDLWAMAGLVMLPVNAVWVTLLDRERPEHEGSYSPQGTEHGTRIALHELFARQSSP